MILPEQVVQKHYFLQSLSSPLALNLVRGSIVLLALLVLYLCRRLRKPEKHKAPSHSTPSLPRNGG